MTKNTPFAYNTGPNVPGTQKIGNISYGTPDSGFQYSELKWWNGPDEDLGYVITSPDPEGLHIGGDGIQAFLGFRRSDEKTETSFITLVNNFSGQIFVSGSTAKAWLDDNGYWTSYGDTITEDGEWFFYSEAGPIDIGPPVNNGNAAFIGASFAFETFNPNKTGEDASEFINFNLFDANGNDYTLQFTDLQDNGGSLSITQNGQTVTYTNEGSQFPVFVIQTSPVGSYFAFSTIHATQTQTATANFNLTDPITIAFNNDSLISPIITHNNEYIEVGENQYLAYNI